MEESLFAVLFEALLLFYAFDAYADGATDVMCNAIRYIHSMGGPMFTVVIIGASLLAIFGRMPWPALFSLGVFVAVFFGGPQIVNRITGREVCCPYGQTLDQGKCVTASGFEYIGTEYCKDGTKCCGEGRSITIRGTCRPSGEDPSNYWYGKK
ncbi:MAG: TrbC/VirB2 family protein [Rickettsiales bacterium]|jgi:type IV secretory pathway VirB2 component (pilin)|nr:TrbC/VirB2 family protein [Rickettsiales bacterium]